MLKKIFAVMLVAVLSFAVVFADTDATADEDIPQTLAEKFSYALGVLCLQNYGVDNAMNYFSYYQYYSFPEADEYFGFLGAYDAMYDSLLFTYDELNSFLEEYPAEYEARMEKIAAENLKAAEDFLAANRLEPPVVTLPSGLQYKVIKRGTGPKPKETDSVELDYKLTLLDGTVVDSSYERGEHSTFPLDSVIEGFKEGVMLMPMDSHYIFYIHPDLGYGDSQVGSMGPNSLLIFEVETYAIEKTENNK